MRCPSVSEKSVVRVDQNMSEKKLMLFRSPLDYELSVLFDEFRRPKQKIIFPLFFFFTFATDFAKMVGLLQVLMSLIFVCCFFFRLTRRIPRLEGFTCSLKKWYTKIIRIYKAFEWLLEETHKVLHRLLSTRKCMTNSPLYLKCVYSGWDGSLYHHLLILVRFYSSEMVIGT